jgi:CubicO group peptidase (beta-lactamase class C family)
VTNGALTALEPGPESDNPPSLGPAGTVHCSLADWGRFVEAHVRGERGDKTALPIATATWKKLHTPAPGGDYALGWAVANAPWSTSPVIAHDGSNGLYYASVTASSARDLVFLVVANRGDPPAQNGVHDVMRYLVDSYTH